MKRVFQTTSTVILFAKKVLTGSYFLLLLIGVAALVDIVDLIDLVDVLRYHNGEIK